MSLIIEDGTGLTTSESYVSVADATTYHANFGNDAWTNIDPVTQEIFLRKATRDLDAIYGTSYLSSMLTKTQSLLWPRTVYNNRDGVSISGIPTQLKNATAELALLNATVDVLGPTDGTGNLKQDIVKIDVLETRKEFFAPTDSMKPKMRKIALMMSSLIKPYATGLYAEVVRG
jgi:hypothetical protein